MAIASRNPCVLVQTQEHSISSNSCTANARHFLPSKSCPSGSEPRTRLPWPESCCCRHSYSLLMRFVVIYLDVVGNSFLRQPRRGFRIKISWSAVPGVLSQSCELPPTILLPCAAWHFYDPSDVHRYLQQARSCPSPCPCKGTSIAFTRLSPRCSVFLRLHVTSRHYCFFTTTFCATLCFPTVTMPLLDLSSRFSVCARSITMSRQ